MVLLSPIVHENVKSADYPDGSANNKNLALYTSAMAEVAKANGVQFVDFFAPSQQLYAGAARPLTINGIHLTEEGDKVLAPVQFKALFGKDGPVRRVLGAAAVFIAAFAVVRHQFQPKEHLSLAGMASVVKIPLPSDIRQLTDDELLQHFPGEAVAIIGSGDSRQFVFLDPE